MPVAENLPGARPRPAFHTCLRPIHACLRPIRACLRPIPRLFTTHPAPVYDPSRASYGFPTPVCGHSAPFTPSRARKSQLPTLPATASSPRPSRRENGGLCPHRAPRGQPLENPFLENDLHCIRLPRPPKRRRRTAPAREPSAVCTLCRRNRNETQRPSPLLVGPGCVNTSPKALVAGTAGPQADGPCSWAVRRLFALPPHPKRNAERPPPARGGGRSSTSSQRLWPSALPTTRGSWSRRRNRPCGRLRGWRNADLLRTRWA